MKIYYKLFLILAFTLCTFNGYCINISNYIIFIPNNPSNDELYSSQLLQNKIKEHYGFWLEIVKGTDSHSKYRIEIGDTELFLQKKDLKYLKEKLEPDGFGIYKIDEVIYLFGDKPRGSYYAVVSFLENDLGIYQLSGTVSAKTEIKKKYKFKNRTQNPAFTYRHLYYKNAYNGKFAEYNKLNPIHYNPIMNDSIGGNIIMYQNCALTHTFNCIIPVSKYYADHPEYFSTYKGQNKLNYVGQLCLSNDTVYNIVKNYVLNLQKEHPKNQIFNFIPNDGPGTCECTRCSNTNNYEESDAGTLIHFINRLSKDLSLKFPTLRYSTLSYLESGRATKHEKVNDNVIIIVSTDTTSWLHSFTPVNLNKPFVKRLNSWLNIAKNVWIWDYSANFNDYLVLHPSIEAISSNLKYYKKVGVRGVLIESQYETTFVEENPLRSFVYSQLLWNPDNNYKEVIKLFVANYYDGASPFINSYYNEIYKNQQYLHKNNNEDFIKNLDIEKLNAINKILSEIEQLNIPDDIKKRVEEWKMPLIYSILKFRNDDLDPKIYISYVKDLNKYFENFKVDRLSNSEYNPWKFIEMHKLRSAFKSDNNASKGTTPPKLAVIDASKFNLLNNNDNPKYPTVRADNEASQGIAVFLPNISPDWYVSYDINSMNLLNYKDNSIKVRMKADRLKETGWGFYFYIMDIVTNKQVYFSHVPNEKLSSKYSIIELYRGKLTNNMRLYFVAIPSNDVKSYSIDYLRFD